MKLSLLMVVLLAGCGRLATPPSPTQRPVAQKDLEGQYFYNKSGGGSIGLVLLSNGSYTQLIPTAAGTLTNTGSWSLNGAHIKFEGLWGSNPTRPEQRETNDFAGLGWYVVDSSGSFALFGGELGKEMIIPKAGAR